MRTQLLFVLLATHSLIASASPTKHWSLRSYGSFRGGKSTGVLLPSSGGLKPGLRTTKEKTKDTLPGLFYTMLKLGNTLYLGSGEPAAIWKRQGTTLKKITTLKGDVVVTTLIKGPGNTLLAGTLPNGKIYKVSPQGKASLLVTLKADHIWDMAYIGTTLYAATGPNAKLFQVNIAGKSAKEIWSVKETHLLSLAVRRGKLLVGTAPEARLYEVDTRSKKGKLLYDFPGNEVREILVGKSALYLAINKLTYRASTQLSTVRVKKTRVPSAPRSILYANHGKVFSRRKVVRGSGALYALSNTGVAEPLFSLTQGYFTALQLQGKLLYGADGRSGRIYRFDTGDFSGAVLMQSEERQVLDFLLEGERNGFACTGDSAALYTLSRSQGKAVSYESVVLDASRIARFGNLLFDLRGGVVTIETRSGITPKADDTLWNPWRPVRGIRALPSGLKQATIKSQPARYLQFKITWPKGSRAEVKWLKLFFLPTNTKPRIAHVKAVLAGTSWSHGLKATTDKMLPTKLSMRSGKVRISWSVLNRDDDNLVFRLWIKKAGDRLWRRLSPRTPLTSTSYTWAAAFQPDGLYVAKVEASDSPSNPPGKHLKSFKISAPFVVDNRAPVLTGLSVRRGVVRFSARDKFSRIVGATYRVGTGSWRMVLPKDGMFDSLVERFQFTLPTTLSKGAHLIQIRLMDSANNISSYSQEFTK